MFNLKKPINILKKKITNAMINRTFGNMNEFMDYYTYYDCRKLKFEFPNGYQVWIIKGDTPYAGEHGNVEVLLHYNGKEELSEIIRKNSRKSGYGSVRIGNVHKILEEVKELKHE